MSVVATVPVIQRPWRGYEDPGLPVGMWIAQGTILGDASAGSATIIFIFKPEGEPLGARFYNVEQIELHTTRNASVNGSLSPVNFDIISSTGLVNRQHHFDLESDNITDSALASALPLPMFLGRPQLVDLEAQLLARIPNTLNETFFFTGQGYIWEPRSLLEDGGLRRPIDSLYGK